MAAVAGRVAASRRHATLTLRSCQGKVLVDGVPHSKAGVAVSSLATVLITAEDPKHAHAAHMRTRMRTPTCPPPPADARCAHAACRFVCRAGYKLEAALDTFGVDVTGAVALDAGLSTGGFTDCLLQRGATRVYGIDVGYGQARQRGSAAALAAPAHTLMRRLRTSRCMTASGAMSASWSWSA